MGFFEIIVYIIIGNIALTILENFSMNIWIARLIACLVVGICGALSHHFKKRKGMTL